MKVRALAFAVIYVARLICFAYAQGVVQIYSDVDCKTPDGSPTPLPAGKCLSNMKAVAIMIVSLPSCTNGWLYISDHQNCEDRPSMPDSSDDEGSCLTLLSGMKIGAAEFLCLGDTTAESAASTVAVSTIPPALPVTMESTPTTSATQTTPNSDPVVSTPGSSPDEEPWPGGGLSQSDKIALGCAIGIGLPALCVAILTWRMPRRIYTRGGAPVYTEAGPAPPYRP